MPNVTATVNLKEPAHYMGPNGEILFTIHPDADGMGVTIDFDFEQATVQVSGQNAVKKPMSLTIRHSN